MAWNLEVDPAYLDYLSLKGTPRHEGDRGNAHRTHGCEKSKYPAGALPGICSPYVIITSVKIVDLRCCDFIPFHDVYNNSKINGRLCCW